MTDTKGILAIWNSVAPGLEGDFEEWYQHEHFHERIGVPGFLTGRRYEAVRGTPPYFCIYLTQSPAVLKSPAYIERLNNPTPQTRKIMSGPFRDMVRTVCGLTARFGAMRGSVAVTARFTVPPANSALEAVARELSADKAVACAEVWTAQSKADFPVSEEERLRGGDARIEACLMVETLRVPDAETVAASLSQRFPGTTVGIYRLLCEIRAGG
ncbi:MAG TPA: hypothetical protein VIU42_18365 [Xanthobacteraceae bacterium]|jgi:hypothetical protein